MQKSKKIILWSSIAAVMLFGIILTIVRYDAWFGNPVEPDYVICGKMNPVLTFGKDNSMVMTWREPGDDVQTTGGSAAFRSHRVVDSSPSIHKILVLGDIQDRNDQQALITRYFIRTIDSLHHPEAIIQLGDLIERPMQCAWNRFSIAFDSIDTVVPIIPILGNHDYFKGFNRHADPRPSLVFPYLCQSDIAACAHLTLCPDTLDLFIVDSNNDIQNLFCQAKWLDKELPRSHALHKILLCHHPLYSTRFPLNNLFVRFAFSPVAEKHNLQLVLTGHEHTYSHTTHPYHQLVSHFSAKSYDGITPRHYILLEIVNNQLSVKVFNETNALVETFLINSEK